MYRGRRTSSTCSGLLPPNQPPNQPPLPPLPSLPLLPPAVVAKASSGGCSSPSGAAPSGAEMGAEGVGAGAVSQQYMPRLLVLQGRCLPARPKDRTEHGVMYKQEAQPADVQGGGVLSHIV